MLVAVVEDAPRAIMLSLTGTCLVVFAAFRARRESWAVLLTLLIGVAGMVAFLALKNIKLNSLNFVALPITFGIGVDYAVNMCSAPASMGPPTCIASSSKPAGRWCSAP